MIDQALKALSQKVKSNAANIETEEGTKNAFIMPFISTVLGYDVFDPSEVVPEYTADVGTKKGEKVDYAIFQNDALQILIECKKIGEKLTADNRSQLFRYFSVTNARIAVLTNGMTYQFFSDLDTPNVMDDKPFLEITMDELNPHLFPELKKITKDSFDLDSVISSASELKVLSQIRKVIAAQFKEPDDEFVRFIASQCHDGTITAKVRNQYRDLTTKALSQYIGDQVNDRLKSALGEDVTIVAAGDNKPAVEAAELKEDQVEDLPADNGIVTTEEELEAFHIVKAIIRQAISVERVSYRDTKSYFGVLVDDNNRKPVCRFHFNGKSKKYIGLLDADKNETRHELTTLDDIFNFADQLVEAVSLYA